MPGFKFGTPEFREATVSRSFENRINNYLNLPRIDTPATPFRTPGPIRRVSSGCQLSQRSPTPAIMQAPSPSPVRKGTPWGTPYNVAGAMGMEAAGTMFQLDPAEIPKAPKRYCGVTGVRIYEWDGNDSGTCSQPSEAAEKTPEATPRSLTVMDLLLLGQLARDAENAPAGPEQQSATHDPKGSKHVPLLESIDPETSDGDTDSSDPHSDTEPAASPAQPEITNIFSPITRGNEQKHDFQWTQENKHKWMTSRREALLLGPEE